jgi:hypothetical protein
MCACGDSTPTAAQADVLVGRWGSPTAELVAIHAGAELTDGCNTVVINEPITLREDGSFQVRGQLRAGLVSGGGQPITVTGQLHGTSVTIAAKLYEADGPATFELESGRARTPDPNLECPQSGK